LIRRGEVDLETVVCYLCKYPLGSIDDATVDNEEDAYCKTCEADLLGSIFEDDLMDEMTRQGDD
jgi:hypothetical protein